MATQIDLGSRIEELREYGLHNIMFRNAGVGLLFFEPPEGFEINPMEQDDTWKQYLVVSRYYPTLIEAVEAECSRLT